jgi:hypothetical protein
MMIDLILGLDPERSFSGKLTGVKPGKHTLELRVVTSDHYVELDAADKVMFVAK